jgi:hypothetical protein
MKTRSTALVLMVFLLASCQSAPVTPEPGVGRGAYGVYTELGKSQVAMKPGSNVRVFNSCRPTAGPSSCTTRPRGS